MTEYRKARKDEGDDLIDFINYVFSQAHNPHDFKKYNPNMYATDYPFWDDHYVAVDGSHIRATVAVTEKKGMLAGTELTFGHVGQVSVHPYFRGNGYMRELMYMGIADMKKKD